MAQCAVPTMNGCHWMDRHAVRSWNLDTVRLCNAPDVTANSRLAADVSVSGTTGASAAVSVRAAGVQHGRAPGREARACASCVSGVAHVRAPHHANSQTRALKPATTVSTVPQLCRPVVTLHAPSDVAGVSLHVHVASHVVTRAQ